MTSLDLRPLSLGEMLDRTFSLYRRYFLLFIGIAGLPQIAVFAFTILQVTLQQNSPRQFGIAGGLGNSLLTLCLSAVSVVAYLFSQGGAVLAVSDLYLGRPITIAEALDRVRSHLGFLFGVIVLNGLAIAGGLVLLIVPGVYLACRLLICVPAALIEDKRPIDSLKRSWELTKGFAGRSFVILLLYVIIAVLASLLLVAPLGIGMQSATKAGGSIWIWLVLTQTAQRVATIIVQPILLIATAILYYDLRVRKEAFDIQFMMNPDAPPPPPGSIPSIL
jgi:hypothetical protein